MRVYWNRASVRDGHSLLISDAGRILLQEAVPREGHLLWTPLQKKKKNIFYSGVQYHFNLTKYFVNSLTGSMLPLSPWFQPTPQLTFLSKSFSRAALFHASIRGADSLQDPLSPFLVDLVHKLASADFYRRMIHRPLLSTKLSNVFLKQKPNVLYALPFYVLWVSPKGNPSLLLSQFSVSGSCE